MWKSKKEINIKERLKRLDARRDNVLRVLERAPVAKLENLKEDTDPRKTYRKLDHTSLPNIESGNFWGPNFAEKDFKDLYKTQKNPDSSRKSKNNRYETITIERDNSKKKNFSDRIPSLLTMRTIAKIHLKTPEIWTKQRLSMYLGLSLDQINRYIQNVELEQKITALFNEEKKETARLFKAGDMEAFHKYVKRRKFPLKSQFTSSASKDEKDEQTGYKGENENDREDEDDDADGAHEDDAQQKDEENDMKEGDEEDGDEYDKDETNTKTMEGQEALLVEKDELKNHLNDQLHNKIAGTFNAEQMIDRPTKTYLLEVFNKRNDNFGYNQKMRLFGVTENNSLRFDLGSKKPKLVLREVPETGEGSGRNIPIGESTKMKSPMIITEISRIKKHRCKDMDIPIRIRTAQGVLRYPTMAEYINIRSREKPNSNHSNFSPIK